MDMIQFQGPESGSNGGMVVFERGDFQTLEVAQQAARGLERAGFNVVHEDIRSYVRVQENSYCEGE